MKNMLLSLSWSDRTISFSIYVLLRLSVRAILFMILGLAQEGAVLSGQCLQRKMSSCTSTPDHHVTCRIPSPWSRQQTTVNVAALVQEDLGTLERILQSLPIHHHDHLMEKYR